MELSTPSPHLRRLDVQRDLAQTADLIELCFSSTLDEEGREYLRQIRRAAKDPAYLRWMPGAYERVSAPLFGYIWEQDHHIVGNLSLIPIQKHGRWVYLIANVAVHPNYRRRGIARELTLRALEHIREHRVSSAWLQVRDDNYSAYELYHSIGFNERSRRTTWINQYNPAPPAAPDIQVSARTPQDWPRQRAWLAAAYPYDVTWNLPFEVDRFQPALWSRLLRWLNGESQANWAARRTSSGELLGVASWESLRSATDSLWLAAPPKHEEAVIRALLPVARRFLSATQHSININYPAGRATTAFYECGFTPLNTLVWMEKLL